MFRRLIILGLVFSVLLFTKHGLSANGIYFPGKMEPGLRSKIKSCETNILPNFEFKINDFLTENLKKTLTKISQRSNLEAKTRAQSLKCLRGLNLSVEEKNLITLSLQDLFQVEVQLYQNYIRWLQSGMGLDSNLFESYFQSRYDLMILIQSKTLQIWKQEEILNDAQVVEDFANLYQSSHRSHFDAIYSLDPIVRERYFYIKEGKKQ